MLDSRVSETPNIKHIIVLCVHNSLVRFQRGKQGIRTVHPLTAIIINNVLKSRFIALRLSSQCIIRNVKVTQDDVMDRGISELL